MAGKSKVAKSKIASKSNMATIDVGEPSFGTKVPTFGKSLNTFVSDGCILKNFKNLRFECWVLKNPSLNLRSEGLAKNLRRFEILSKNLQRFLKVYESHRFDQVWGYFWKWCWISNCVHDFDQNYMFGQLQKKIRFRYAYINKLKNTLFWCRHNTFKNLQSFLNHQKTLLKI